jgi:hypothetical protein
VSVLSHPPGVESRPPDRLTGESSHLTIHAVSSDLRAAPALLAATTQLASDLNARVVLLFAEVVPYPIPLSEPHIQADVLESLIGRISQPVAAESFIEIFLCRDGNQTVREQLPPESTVVMQNISAWWKNPWRYWSERAFAKCLRREGHHVILVTLDTLDINNLEDIVKVKSYGDIQFLYTQRRA